jgi:DNA-binding transcriptional MerR regulator
MQGRTALYSKRHLLQLVAIKRLQAKGRTLGELQKELVGLTDSVLARIAQLPSEDLQNLPERRSNAFWQERPVPLEKRDPQQTQKAIPWQGVPLSDDVTLLLRPMRALEEDDVEAIQSATEPLLKLLEKRHLS